MKLAYCTPNSCSPSYRNSNVFGFPAFSGLAPFLDLTQNISTPRLAADLSEDDNAYTAVLELPGVKRENLKVDITADTLTVSAERKMVVDGEEATRTYSRSFSLPRDVARESVAAKLEDGLLTLSLPKAEDTKPRSVAIA
jgi:HSP20 family protein